MKKQSTNIFEFTVSERKGVIVMIILLLLLIAVNSFLHVIIPAKHPVLKVSNLKETDTLPQYTNTVPKTQGAPASKEYLSNTAQNNKIIQVIDLNAADSLALVSLNGIGPVFAARIIKYRALLGGFYKKEQLKEVYGFDEEKYNLVAPHVAVKLPVVKINLNTCTFKELNKHPYIEYEVTKAIFNLKKKLGKFQSVEEIKQVDLVSEELYNKIAPYLTTQ